MRKTIITFFMILCLSSLMFLAGLSLYIQPAWAIETIYITPDGSIDPPTAPIHRDGDLYTLTANITSEADGIVIERNNMTLDGNGYTLQGSGSGLGIYLEGRDNVTIKKMEIQEFEHGIALLESSNNSILENRITGNKWNGIGLENSSTNSLSRNLITNNQYGIGFWLSSNNTVYHNTLINNIKQAYIQNSTNIWDDGYPSGGNYWGDYDGTDLYSGPHQNETGSDGVGDTPYVINTKNEDEYPLMTPMTLTYYDLLDSYATLTANYTALQSSYDGLLTEHDNLNLTYHALQHDYDTLTANYTALQSSYDELQQNQAAILNEVSTFRNIMYIFTTTTATFIATTIYFAAKRPKTKPKKQ